jgi:hypothetical protein
MGGCELENENNDANEDSLMQDIGFQHKQGLIIIVFVVILLIVVSINCSCIDLYYEDVSSWDEATRTYMKVTEVALKKTVDAATGTQEYKDDAAVLTSYWKANIPVLTGIVLTQTSLPKTWEAWLDLSKKQTWTAVKVTLDFEDTKTVEAKLTQTAEAKILKPPVLKRIEMPYIIPKTGEAAWVTVYYEDPDGDVSHYGCEVIDAYNWTCGKHEIVHWLTGTKYKGTFRFTMTCYGNQNVELAMRLYDEKGNVSKPYIIFFVCR